VNKKVRGLSPQVQCNAERVIRVLHRQDCPDVLRQGRLSPDECKQLTWVYVFGISARSKKKQTVLYTHWNYIRKTFQVI
jgi:hypothetical protein